MDSLCKDSVSRPRHNGHAISAGDVIESSISNTVTLAYVVEQRPYCHVLCSIRLQTGHDLPMATQQPAQGERLFEGQRRSSYTVLRRQDRWMVPLLADAIQRSLEEYARPLARNGRCLDVGCGEQPLRREIETLGFEYSGMDTGHARSAQVDFIGAIDAVLPKSLPQAAFDFVVCTEVLEHVADWPAAFANLASLLKPGGRVLITCPHIWVPHEEPYDFFRPTSLALAHYAKTNGLHTLKLERLGDGHDVLGTVLAAVRVRAPARQPWLWLLAAPLSLLRKFTLAFLGGRIARALIEMPTPLYLNTIAVFEKPAIFEGTTILDKTAP
jgi:SAM-dependent methyltransferase